MFSINDLLLKFMEMKNVLDLEKAIAVVKQLGKEFSSHDFIHKYSKQWEKEYVKELQEKYDSSHQAFHSQIGRFLDANADKLGIQKKTGKESGKGDPTVFGNETEVQGWIRIE